MNTCKYRFGILLGGKRCRLSRGLYGKCDRLNIKAEDCQRVNPKLKQYSLEEKNQGDKNE